MIILSYSNGPISNLNNKDTLIIATTRNNNNNRIKNNNNNGEDREWKDDGDEQQQQLIVSEDLDMEEEEDNTLPLSITNQAKTILNSFLSLNNDDENELESDDDGGDDSDDNSNQQLPNNEIDDSNNHDNDPEQKNIDESEPSSFTEQAKALLHSFLNSNNNNNIESTTTSSSSNNLPLHQQPNSNSILTPYIRSPDPKDLLLLTKQSDSSHHPIPVCVIAGNPRHRSIFSRNIPYMSGSGKFTYMTVDPTYCQYHGSCSPIPQKNRNPSCHPLQPTIFINPYTRCCGVDRFRRVQTLTLTKLYDLSIVTGDEYCEITGDSQGRTPHQLRNYYSDNLIHNPDQDYLPSYLPLGPRFEFTFVTPEEFHYHTSISNPRPLILNFMGSLTSKIRIELVDLLEEMIRSGQLTRNETVIHLSQKWATAIRPDTGYMSPEVYRETLLKSTLTLCPSGHNPEAYRIFEAIEAGSIPVLALGKDYRSSACRNAFQPFIDSKSPIPMLSSWKELPQFIHRVKTDSAFVWDLRIKITNWYRDFMHAHFLVLENALENNWKQRLERNNLEYDEKEVFTFLKTVPTNQALLTSSNHLSNVVDQTRLDDLSRFWGFTDVDAVRDFVALEEGEVLGYSSQQQEEEDDVDHHPNDEDPNKDIIVMDDDDDSIEELPMTTTKSLLLPWPTQQRQQIELLIQNSLHDVRQHSSPHTICGGDNNNNNRKSKKGNNNNNLGSVCVITDALWQANIFKSGLMSSCGVGFNYVVVGSTPCQRGISTPTCSLTTTANNMTSLVSSHPRCPNTTWPTIRIISWVDGDLSSSSSAATKRARIAKERFNLVIKTAPSMFDLVIISGDDRCLLKPPSISGVADEDEQDNVVDGVLNNNDDLEEKPVPTTTSGSNSNDNNNNMPPSHARHLFGKNVASEVLRVETLNKPLWIPLGPRTEFMMNSISSEQSQQQQQQLSRKRIPLRKRQYLYSFIGSASSEARRVLERAVGKNSEAPFGSKGELGKLGYFALLGPPVGDLKESKDFLDPAEYRKIVMNSQFILCPRGHHFETNRLYEAVEVGAIPIMARGGSYLDHTCSDSLAPFQQAPIIWIKEWTSHELEVIFRKAISEPKWVEKLSRNVTAWFHSLHRESALNLESILIKRWENRLINV
jgi:hypothetical protein